MSRRIMKLLQEAKRDLAPTSSGAPSLTLKKVSAKARREAARQFFEDEAEEGTGSDTDVSDLIDDEVAHGSSSDPGSEDFQLRYFPKDLEPDSDLPIATLAPAARFQDLCAKELASKISKTLSLANKGKHVGLVVADIPQGFTDEAWDRAWSWEKTKKMMQWVEQFIQEFEKGTNTYTVVLICSRM